MTLPGIDDEGALLRETTRKFLEDECPMARVRALAETERGFDSDLWRRTADLGWLSLALPDEYGGLGRGLAELAVVAEEMGRALHPGPFLPTMVAASVVAEQGTAAQRRDLLPGIAAGETVLAWCASEAAGTWDATDVATTAERDGRGLVLRGAKSYVQDAHVADLLLVAARVDGGIANVLVPRGARGVDVSPLRTLDLTRRLCAVSFDGVRLGREAVVGEAHAADRALERPLQIAIGLLCAESVGGAERLLQMATAHARERVQFGRPIGSFQAIKHKCADMLVRLEACKAAASYATATAEQRSAEAPLAASVAKAYVGEAYTRIAQDALQVHGGMGFTWEHDVHLYLRRAKSNEVLFGTPRRHRERVCRLSGLPAM